MQKLIKISNSKEIYLDPNTVLMVLPNSTGFADVLTSIGGKIETDMAPISLVKLVNEAITTNVQETRK